MNTIITLKQFRTDMPRVIEEIAKGRSFTVIKRSQPVFEITPAKEDIWDFDFRDAGHPGGIPADELLAVMRHMKPVEK